MARCMKTKVWVSDCGMLPWFMMMGKLVLIFLASSYTEHLIYVVQVLSANRRINAQLLEHN